MKKYIALFFVCFMFYPVLQVVGQAQSDATVQSGAPVSADSKAKADKKARKEADARAALELKAKKEAEKKANSEARLKAEADKKAKIAAEKEAKLKAEAEQKAKEAAEKEANLKAKAEQKAKADADKKTREEADAKAALELKVKKEAEKKAANEAKLKAEADKKAREVAEKEAAAAAKAKIAAEKKAKDAAEKEAAIKAEAEQKAREAAEKEAAAVAKAKAEAEKKADQAAELKAKEEITAKETMAATAGSEAKRKKAEADKAVTAAKKAAADENAMAEANRKAREEATAKEIQAKDTAAIALARETELKKAQEDLANSRQARTNTKQKSGADEKLAAELKAKEKIAAAARLTANRKAAEADKAATAAKKAAADENALVEASRKAREEAAAKESQAKDTAAIALARETELKKAQEDLANSRQARIKARQQAAADAKAKKEAAIEAKINGQEKAPTIKTGEGQLSEAPEKSWWKRNFENAAKPEEAGKWKFSAGVLLRMIHGQTFKTYSYSQNYNIPAKAGDVARRYEPAGDLNSASDRNYEDGYVHKDDYTDLDGGTENWDYDNAGQIQGNSVTFHFVGRTYTEYTRSKETSVGETHNNSDREIAPYIQLERVLYRAGWFDTGLHLDLARVTFSDAAQYANFSDRQEWKNYVQYDEDVYSLSGAPVIDNVPDARRGAGTVETGSYSYNAVNNIKQSLDMNLGTFSLGPVMSANWRRFSLSGIAGPTFNWVNIQTDYTETLYAAMNNGNRETLQTWNDSQDYSECKFGGFVQAQLGLRIIDGFGVGIFGRYDWLENMSGSLGQSRYMINPEGGSLGATANLSF